MNIISRLKLNSKSIMKKTLLSLGVRITFVDKQEELVLEKLSKIFEKYSLYTMISKSLFIENLRLCQKFAQIKGSVVECGVWRGGMISGIAELLGDSRSYYLFDSFEGLPKVTELDGKAAKEWQEDKQGPMYHNNCMAEISYAEQAMKLSKVSNYRLVKGWFIETLPKFDSNEEIAILRLDADWYDSTMQCLEFLYPKVVKGGLIILDDYYTWDGCARAVHDYLSKYSLPHRIYELDGGNCYIIKNE
jgi:O-methyltransferase